MKSFRFFGFLAVILSQVLFAQVTWTPNNTPNTTTPRGAWFVGWYGGTGSTCNNQFSTPYWGPNTISPSSVSVASTCQNGVTVFQFTTNNATNLASAKSAGNFFSATIAVGTSSPLIRVSDTRVTQTQSGLNFSGAYNYGMTITDIATGVETDVVASQSVPSGASSSPSVTYTTLGTPYVMYPGKSYLIKWYLWTGTSGQIRGIDNPELYFQTASCATNTTVPNLNAATNFNNTNNIFTIPCGTSPAVANLSGISASNAPTAAGFPNLSWHSATPATPANRITDVTALAPGTYYAAFASSDYGCFTSTRQVVVRKELCVNNPPSLTVYVNTKVDRSLSQAINPAGGSGTYTYSVGSGCPSGGATPLPASSNLTITGTTATYTSPSTPGTYYYCVQVCDNANPQQCKTVTFTVNVVSVPVFSCDQTLYVSQFPAGGATTLSRLNDSSNPFTLSAIGTTSTNVQINAIGYNPVNNYIYGIDNNRNLVLMDVSGNLANTFTVSGLPNSYINNGDFDSEGNMYVFASDTSTMYKIPVLDGSATSYTATAITLSQSVGTHDIAYNKVKNLLYGYDNTAKYFVSITPTGAVTRIGAQTNLGAVGSMFAGALGNTYGIENSTGNFYQFNLSTGAPFLIAKSPTQSGNDGAHCSNSIINFKGDVQVTKTSAATTFTPGQNVVYTITVKNNSSFGIQGIEIVDNVPTGIPAANISYTVASTDGVSYSDAPSGSGNIDHNLSLAGNGFISYTVTLAIPIDYVPATVTNTVQLVFPVSFSDTVSTNNTSSYTHNSTVCYKAATAGTGLPVNHGITGLNRASSDVGTWPTVRTGAHTVLESRNRGFVINRVASPETAISNPVEGMLVFDTAANSGEGCLKLYNGNSWNCINTQTCNN